MRLLYRRGLSVCAAPHELLVEWNTFATEGALVGTVCGKVPAYEAEDRPAPQIHRCAPPETPDADDLRPELFHQLDQQIQSAAGRDEVLHQQDLGPRPEQPMEFDRETHASLSARQA